MYIVRLAFWMPILVGKSCRAFFKLEKIVKLYIVRLHYFRNGSDHCI